MSNGQVVLVTGASSGMGKETATALIEAGYTVYGAARRVERMRDLEALGGTALEMDITVEEDVVAVVDRIARDHGGVDILINNAGFGLYGAVEDIEIDAARYQFAVNLFGLARLTQLVLPHMREQGAGKIVNMSSMGGRIYTPLGAWYHASKHALEGWSDCLRIEVAPFGIDVIVIEPGFIETSFGGAAADSVLDRSGEGPYAELAHDVVAATRRTYEEGGSSDPAGVATVILRAIQSERPRTRYAVGRFARLLIFARTHLGDRFFDWLMINQVRGAAGGDGR